MYFLKRVYTYISKRILIPVTLPNGPIIRPRQILGDRWPWLLVIRSWCLVFSTVERLFFYCLFGSFYRFCKTELIIYVNEQSECKTFNPLAWCCIIKYKYWNIYLVVICGRVYNCKSSLRVSLKFLWCHEVWLVWCQECAIHFSDITDITWLRSLAPEFLGQLLVPTNICSSSTDLREWNIHKFASVMH